MSNNHYFQILLPFYASRRRLNLTIVWIFIYAAVLTATYLLSLQNLTELVCFLAGAHLIGAWTSFFYIRLEALHNDLQALYTKCNDDLIESEAALHHIAENREHEKNTRLLVESKNRRLRRVIISQQSLRDIERKRFNRNIKLSNQFATRNIEKTTSDVSLTAKKGAEYYYFKGRTDEANKNASIF